MKKENSYHHASSTLFNQNRKWRTIKRKLTYLHVANIMVQNINQVWKSVIILMTNIINDYFHSEFNFIHIQSPLWTCVIKLSILQHRFLSAEKFGLTTCTLTLAIHFERMVKPSCSDGKLINWQCFYSCHKALFKSVDAHNKHYTVKNCYIEDLTWVVSWDQNFLNEFNKVAS